MRSHVRALIVFAAALAIKAAVLFALHDHPLLQPRGDLDPAVYVELGQRVAGGDLLLGDEPFYVSPLYIYFLGAVFGAGGGLLAARIVQIVLGALAVVFVSETARASFGPKAGWISTALMALSGVVTFYEITILQSALDPFLVALTFYLHRHRLGGIPAGLLVLNRPNALLWLAVYGAYLIWRERAKAFPFLLGAAVVIAPVTIRNWIVSGQPVLISSHGGLNLYIGNNPQADGTYRAPAGIRPDIRGQHVDAQRIDFTKRALDWIRGEPLAALRLFARKLAYTFNQRDIPLNHSYAFYALDPPLRFLIVGPWLLFPLAAIAFLRAPRAIASFLIVYGLSVALFFVSTRYRLPLLVAAAPLAGGGAVALLERKRNLLVAAIVAVFVIWNYGTDTGIANERAELAVHEIEQGGAPRIEDIAREHPDPALVHLRAGYALQKTKRNTDAIAMFERALTAPTREPETHTAAATELAAEYAALGKAAMDARDPAAALGPLRRVVDLQPNSASAHANLGLAYIMSGNHAAALPVLETAHRLDPNNASTLLNLAVLRAQRGDFDTARRGATEALRLQPDYPQARQLLEAVGRASARQ